MNLALNAAASASRSGSSLATAMRLIKRESSFGGDMRKPLVEMLNKLGYSDRLGLDCASRLWKDADHLVQFCSLLKYPVFFNGSDYNNTPKMIGNAALMNLVREHFVRDLLLLPADAVLVPLGEAVLQVLVHLQKDRLLPQQLLRCDDQYVAVPHPSGQNGEAVALVLLDEFPSLDEYVEIRHRTYLAEKSWLVKGRPGPQAAHVYRGKRARYWRAAALVRRAHGL